MYSISENLDNTECSGWINQNLLLKDSDRRTSSRKRSYDLSNADIEQQCGEDLRRRVLRPRHNPEPQSSPGASRTRPIRSNRTRRRQVARPMAMTDFPGASTENHEHATPLVSSASSFPNVTDLSFLQALASYNWPQNYHISQADQSILHRLQQPTYPQLGQGMPQFDPWILHNYLLASSGYSSGGHISQESIIDNQNTTMPQLGYPSMIADTILSQNLIWQYPFLLNPAYSSLQSQVTRPPELNLNIPPSHVIDSHQDLSYLFRPSNRSHADTANDATHSGVYHNDRHVLNFNNHILPSPFSYGSLCPYHNTNHIIHHNQPSSHSIGNTSSNISESPLQQLPFNSYRNTSEVTYGGQYWHPMTTSLRSVNYPINSSNIDTLLHLAAHFEQRKRGITREELDKLPTHRHKVVLEKVKKEKPSDKSKEDEQPKCLVCLDDFEPKQSIRTLHCKHEFHAKCIDKWLKINRTCPLCRSDAFDGAAQKEGL